MELHQSGDLLEPSRKQPAVACVSTSLCLMIDLRQQLPAPRSAPGFLAAEGRLILFGGVGDSGKEILNFERSQRVSSIRVLPTRFVLLSEAGSELFERLPSLLAPPAPPLPSSTSVFHSSPLYLPPASSPSAPPSLPPSLDVSLSHTQAYVSIGETL